VLDRRQIVILVTKFTICCENRTHSLLLTGEMLGDNPIAQWLAHFPGKEKTTGSIPVSGFRL
jgi:hypothetical protein